MESAVDDFQKALSEPQRRTFLSSNVVPNANDVLAFTAEIDKTNAMRQSRCVASRLQGSLSSVQQFSPVVDTFVSSNPHIAGLIWGSVRLTILIASNYASFFDGFSSWFMKLRLLCPNFREYQTLYPDSVRLQEALCSFYTVLIQFCTKAMQVMEKRGKQSSFIFAYGGFFLLPQRY